MLTKADVEAIVAELSYKPKFSFRVEEDGDKRFIQVCEDAICNRTRKPYDSKGRKWIWSPWMVKSEIVSTCFMACMAYEEHETRENFKYKGESIYDPHYAVDALWELRRSGESEDVRS